MNSPLIAHWREIIGVFLKLGAMSYGGPAIMGLMQNECQQKRNWLSKEQFVEGLALVNMLPGPGATQVGIFLGYVRGGWWGGVLAGMSFILPAFLIMLVLTWTYLQYGTLPSMRNVFYGLSPVVVGIFLVAVWRLGKSVLKEYTQYIIAVVIALLLHFTPASIVPLLLLAGATGVMLYDSRKWGFITNILIMSIYALWLTYGEQLKLSSSHEGLTAGLAEISVFFFKTGLFTFGGGLSVLAFIQDQVVNQLHWLSTQQFLDGLALGQLTPGPILMIAAFVGYQKASFVGAAAAATAIFLPSFLLMLSILPIFDRIKKITWMKAALRGISPAVIGMIGVAMLHMLPSAVSDWLTAILMVLTVYLLIRNISNTLTVMIGGGIIGYLIHLF